MNFQKALLMLNIYCQQVEAEILKNKTAEKVQPIVHQEDTASNSSACHSDICHRASSTGGDNSTIGIARDNPLPEPPSPEQLGTVAIFFVW